MFYWWPSTRDIDGTYTSKIFVQQLYVSVDDLQSDQFIILVLYSTAEIKAGISKQVKRVTTKHKSVTNTWNLAIKYENFLIFQQIDVITKCQAF